MSLKKRFILTFSILLIAGFLILGMSLFFFSQQALRGTVDDSLDLVADSTLRNLSLYVSNIRKDISMISASLTGSLSDPDALDGELNRIWDKLGYGELLEVADLSGDVLTMPPNEEGVYINITDRAYYQASLKGEIFISDVLISKASGLPIFVVSAPFFEDGRITGVVLVSVPLTEFSLPYLRPIRFGKEGYCYLMNSAGLVLYHPKDTHILTLDLSIYDWGVEMLEQRNGFQNYVFEGISKKVAYRQEPNTGWILAITGNDSDIYSVTYTLGWITVVICVVITVLAIVMTLFSLQGIVSGIARAIDITGKVALGDLNQNLDSSLLSRRDEIGKLGNSVREMIDSLNTKAGVLSSIAKGRLDIDIPPSEDYDVLGRSLFSMTDSLNSLLTGVQEVSRQVNMGAGQVADSSHSLSQSATQQMASVEEISALLTEINDQAGKNAEKAVQALSISRETSKFASDSSERMEKLRSSMERIQEFSIGIQQVVKVIEDIAFQINLLSLNAGVEAARAGKYGRGFSVVAEEVRKLALRSGASVKETAAIVETSVREISEVFNMTQEMTVDITRISTQSSEIGGVLESIVDASGSQAGVISDINDSMDQIQEISQSNTASAEEGASAAEELASQAKILEQEIGRFVLRN